MELIVNRVSELGTFVVEQLSQPWTPVQLLLIVIAISAAFLINRWVEPPLEERIRRIRQWPRMLRLLAVVLRRTRWILAAAFLWITVAVLREVTWPSRSYLVSIAAILVTAWAGIAIASRAIRNRTLAQLVAIVGWGLVALAVLGLLEPTARILDAFAFTLGAFRLSALVVLKGVALLAALLWLAGLAGDLAERWLQKRPDVTPSLQVLISKLTKVVLFVIAVIVTLSTIGVDLTALTVFSGAIGLGLGFGLQKVVSNLVSGMIILADKSIKPGDVIQLGETFGWIRSLRARFVSVVTRDGREYLIPNEDLITQKVINWTYTDELVRLDVTFGVSYDSDPHLVRRLAVDAAKRVPRVQSSPAPVCHLKDFGESSLDFILRFWIADPSSGLTNVRGAVLLACWDAFKENDIAIPFPHREVIVRTAPLAEPSAPAPD